MFILMLRYLIDVISGLLLVINRLLLVAIVLNVVVWFWEIINVVWRVWVKIIWHKRFSVNGVNRMASLLFELVLHIERVNYSV